MYMNNKKISEEVQRLVKDWKAESTSSRKDTLAGRIVDKTLEYIRVSLPGIHKKNTQYIEDDKQDLRVGIWEALLTYEESLSNFTTWAMYKARKRLYRSATRDRIKLPSPLKDQKMTLSKFISQWERATGQRPTDEDIVSHTKIPECILKKLSNLVVVESMPVYMDVPAPTSKELSDVDLSLALDVLTSEERLTVERIIIKQQSLQQAATALGVSKTKCTEIYNSAVEKLRKVYKEFE